MYKINIYIFKWLHLEIFNKFRSSVLNLDNSLGSNSLLKVNLGIENSRSNLGNLRLSFLETV